MSKTLFLDLKNCKCINVLSVWQNYIKDENFCRKNRDCTKENKKKIIQRYQLLKLSLFAILFCTSYITHVKDKVLFYKAYVRSHFDYVQLFGERLHAIIYRYIWTK